MTKRAMSIAATSAKTFAWAALLILLGAGAFAGPAEAASNCSASYCVGQCARGCMDPELGGAMTTCQNWLLENGVQGDSDGVDNWSDNCVCRNNADQTDCDGDGEGNVCDTLNGTFQPVDRWRACASDRDNHAGWYKIEVTEHREFHDTSACHAGTRWDQHVESSVCTLNYDEFLCCLAALPNDDDRAICHPVGQYSCNPDTLP